MKKLFYGAALLMASTLIVSCTSAEDGFRSRLKKCASTSELGTVEATIKKVVKVADSEWYKLGDRKILFSCTAHVKAGFLLEDFEGEQIQFKEKGSDVELTLPKARLLSLNMPVSEANLTYSHVSTLRSDFSVEDRNKILTQGEEDIRQDIPNLGVLEEAQKNAEVFFTSLLKQMGYKNIIINFRDNE